MRRPRLTLPVLATTLTLLLACAASAGATSNIEGVWAFENGQIAIESQPSGTFVGKVVEATKFAECVHPVGQEIWTDITPQPDGSYWGDHQWYLSYEGTCSINETPGPTAWRVEEEPNGSKYLRVCLSEPGTSQPTIPASGAETGVTYSCVNSALTAPLPTTSKSGVNGERLSVPSSKICLSGRHFKIHLLEPKYDPFKTVLVTLRGHKIETVHKGNYVVATINLRGLKRGAFTVKIHATTILGHHLSSSRTYHTCRKKHKKSKPAKAR